MQTVRLCSMCAKGYVLYNSPIGTICQQCVTNVNSKRVTKMPTCERCEKQAPLGRVYCDACQLELYPTYYISTQKPIEAMNISELKIRLAELEVEKAQLQLQLLKVQPDTPHVFPEKKVDESAAVEGVCTHYYGCNTDGECLRCGDKLFHLFGTKIR